jgi:molecular chaperone GrpE
MEKTAEKNQGSIQASQPEKLAVEVKQPEIEKQLADYKDSLQRLQAEFENYKKRVEKEKFQAKQCASAEMAKALLPVLDTFELALKSVGNCGKDSCSESKIIKGMELIYSQFFSALESNGLRPIKAVGQRFDPYLHEVMLQGDTPDEKKDGIVVEEFQRGYFLNDIVLRYSKVRVLKYVHGGEKQ